VRATEAEPIAITSSGGTAQDDPSKSDSRTDPLLFDSSPSTPLCAESSEGKYNIY
jgi:hypothetical protein